MIALLLANGLSTTGSASQMVLGASGVVFFTLLYTIVQQSGVGSSSRSEDEGTPGEGINVADGEVPLPGFQIDTFADQPKDDDTL